MDEHSKAYYKLLHWFREARKVLCRHEWSVYPSKLSKMSLGAAMGLYEIRGWVEERHKICEKCFKYVTWKE